MTRRAGLGLGGAAAAAAGLGTVARRRAWVRRMDVIRATYDYAEPAPATPCGPLAARVAGPPAAPVLLIHGLAASSRSWGAAYDTLAVGHRLVVPDLLGFGVSSKPASATYSLDEHADLVAECVAAAGAASTPAVVAAHSFGILVALALVRRHPGLVSGIVAVAPPVFRDAAHARTAMLGALTRGERVFAMDTPWASLACRTLCCRIPHTAERLARAYRPELPAAIAADGVRHTWLSYSRSLAGLLSAEGRPEWAVDAGVPLRLITGTRDPLPDLAYLRSLAAASPLVEVETVEGADHVLHLSHAPRCLELIDALAATAAAAA